ncbi:hypothetical protein IT411_02855 [Candidatus Peregrinibacteria bacterium]|nr:hypothetical protein [Candidatus Peregrinibacteria bacterium]
MSAISKTAKIKIIFVLTFTVGSATAFAINTPDTIGNADLSTESNINSLTEIQDTLCGGLDSVALAICKAELDEFIQLDNPNASLSLADSGSGGGGGSSGGSSGGGAGSGGSGSGSGGSGSTGGGSSSGSSSGGSSSISSGNSLGNTNDVYDDLDNQITDINNTENDTSLSDTDQPTTPLSPVTENTSTTDSKQFLNESSTVEASVPAEPSTLPAGSKITKKIIKPSAVSNTTKIAGPAFIIPEAVMRSAALESQSNLLNVKTIPPTINTTQNNAISYFTLIMVVFMFLQTTFLALLYFKKIKF